MAWKFPGPTAAPEWQRWWSTMGLILKELHHHLSQRLPAYACPVMVRICATLDTTETFKQKKQDLIREGFDPRVVKDPVFFRDPESDAYVPLDAEPMHASSTA